jgi:hypothetical protein
MLMVRQIWLLIFQSPAESYDSSNSTPMVASTVPPVLGAVAPPLRCP